MCAPSLVETLRPPAAVKRAREPHRLRGRIHLSKQINVYIYIYSCVYAYMHISIYI